jgi:hypothetical protein
MIVSNEEGVVQKCGRGSLSEVGGGGGGAGISDGGGGGGVSDDAGGGVVEVGVLRMAEEVGVHD